MDPITFLLLRLTIAASMLGHGLVRLPKLSAFSNWMVTSFEKSILPKMLVIPFSYVLPLAEFTVGVLLFTGLFTRPASIAGAIIMIILIFGTTMLENWEAVPSQLIHVTFYAVLLQFSQYNVWALDNLFKK
jgi:thiosulfate dehydrogenase [quinone] large subunit